MASSPDPRSMDIVTEPSLEPSVTLMKYLHDFLHTEIGIGAKIRLYDEKQVKRE
jgi:hypothetical protein